MKLLDEWYIKMIRWRRNHIDRQTFIILLAIGVGLLAGLAAVLLKTLITTVADYVTIFPRYLLFLIPLVGIILVSALKQYFFKEGSEYTGIGNLLQSISKHSAYIHPSLMYSRLITAGLTMGFGGSAGIESTIVVTGSSIGSNVSRFFRMQNKYRTLMIACGAAAGIAALFNAPIAGVIFALEVVLPAFSTTLFIPILIASASGALFAHVFLEGEFIFNVAEVADFQLVELPFIIVLGLACGLVSLYFTYLSFSMGSWLNKIKFWLWRAIIGGVLLGLVLSVLPLFYGEGYLSINQMLNGETKSLLLGTPWDTSIDNSWKWMLFFAGLVILKPIASNLTILSGGDGGNFAPSFITGGYLGYLFYLMASNLFPEITLSPVNYILIGMAGVLSGVMHAPLMAIFIIAEVSGSYALFIPLMIISALSYFIKYHYEQVPIFLAGRGQYSLAQFHHESLPLNQMKVSELVETEFEHIPVESTLKELLPKIAKSKRNIFPVLTKEQELAGIVLLDDIRGIMFDNAKQETPIIDIMHNPPAMIEYTENMSDVMRKFDETEAWNLPVSDQGIYKGFLSKSRIFNAYRRELSDSRLLE